MAHRIVVNVQTGEVSQVEYTAEEQAAYDAAIVAQVAETSVQNETPTEVVVETPVEPTQEV